MKYFKQFLYTTALMLCLPLLTHAQKFAYVSTDYILEQMGEYKEAQKTLDNLSIAWQKDIEAKYAAIDKMYK